MPGGLFMKESLVNVFDMKFKNGKFFHQNITVTSLNNTNLTDSDVHEQKSNFIKTGFRK